MTGDAQNIEWVVAEVLRRLERLATAPPSSGDEPASRPANDCAEGDLVIQDRVVTLREIEGRMQHVRRVLVPQGAVVTPSVKDELRKKHVRLEFQTAPQVGQAPAAELTVVRCVHSSEAARGLSQLTYPPGAKILAHEDLQSAARTVATCVEDARQIAVLLSDDPFSAHCLANRFAAVRAAYVQDVGDVTASIAAIGANVIVVDPRRVAGLEWPELVAAFRRGLPRSCPAHLRGSAT